LQVATIFLLAGDISSGVRLNRRRDHPPEPKS
jgi:hypothetical protein